MQVGTRMNLSIALIVSVLFFVSATPVRAADLNAIRVRSAPSSSWDELAGGKPILHTLRAGNQPRVAATLENVAPASNFELGEKPTLHTLRAANRVSDAATHVPASAAQPDPCWGLKAIVRFLRGGKC